MGYNLVKKIYTHAAITAGGIFRQKIFVSYSPEAYSSTLGTLFIQLYILPHISYYQAECRLHFTLWAWKRNNVTFM